MAVTETTLRLSQSLRKSVAAILDEQTRALTAAWIDALDEVSTDLREATLDLVASAKDGTVTRTQALRSTRLPKSLASIADALDDVTTKAGVRIGTDLPDIVRAAGEAQQAIITSQLPASERAIVAGWSRIDADAIEAIVKRSTEQITAATYPISGDAYQAVRRELIRGVSVGDNPRETARRMVARTEGAFNGGLTRALNVSRTEVLDAHRAASALSHDANADTLKGWTWVADLGPRCCPSCWSQHGSEHDLNEPGPFDHQSGRCSRVPIAKTWADLGITGMDEPASVMPDARAVFDDLPQADRLAVMGPQRLALLDKGEVKWADLSVKKSTDGWRDSFGTRPVKDLVVKAPPTIPTIPAAPDVTRKAA